MKKIIIFMLAAALISGCKKNQDKKQNLNQNIQSFEHNGIEREYLTFVPSTYSDSSSVPLVLNFHGFGGNISEYSSYASMEALAELENFILVYPQGTQMNGYSHWNPSLPSTTNKSSADDLGFIDALIQKLALDYSLDLTRVYACGYSNGGMMSYGIAHHKSDLIAAVASISGAMLDEETPPTHPMPVLIIHGTSDNVIPYNGNGDYNSVGATVNYWKNFNNIDSLTNTNNILNGGVSIQYESYGIGDNGVSVELYKINQGGHQWFNLNYEGQNTGELIWSFFSKYNIDGLVE